MRWLVELAIVTLALVGLWVTLDKAAAGIVRAWAWLRRDRVGPLLEDSEGTGVLCAGCAGFEHCDGQEGACDCTCGWDEDWAEQELPPEQSAEALGFIRPGAPVRETMADKPGGYLTPETLQKHIESLGGTFEPAHPRTFLERLEARRERLASAAELEHRAAYEAMGWDYPSGLMARVREGVR